MTRFRPSENEPGSTLVPVVWFETIKRWKAVHDKPMSSLFFHKVATLTRFRLEQKGIRVPLPFSWYRFGAAAADLPHAIQFYPDVESEETDVDWHGPEPELYLGDRAADAIRSTIDEILRDYPFEKGELAVDEVYTHAPFEFQSKYRRVRMAFGLTGLGSAEREGLNVVGGPRALLLDALDEFPYERFPQLASSVGYLRETVSACLNGPTLEQRRRLAGEAIEAFWIAFADFLRLDPEGHKDVSAHTIQRWRRDAERTLRAFVRNLEDMAVEVASWEPAVIQDPTLGPLVERRRTEQVDEERQIEEGLDALWGSPKSRDSGETRA